MTVTSILILTTIALLWHLSNQWNKSLTSLTQWRSLRLRNNNLPPCKVTSSNWWLIRMKFKVDAQLSSSASPLFRWGASFPQLKKLQTKIQPSTTRKNARYQRLISKHLAKLMYPKKSTKLLPGLRRKEERGQTIMQHFHLREDA
jgi:hypothetical protein